MNKQKIVITGGPSGGKTTLIEALQKDMADRVAVVPEAASILYKGGFPRKSSVLGKKHAQRAICFVQREVEDFVAAESTQQVIVCDRGSLDSIAYWPGNADDFFKSLNTTRPQEIARYNWVIHLDTAAKNNFDSTNPIRIESHKESLELNHMIKEAWQGHPQRIVIPHADEFIEKIAKAKIVIELILDGSSYSDVVKAL